MIPARRLVAIAGVIAGGLLLVAAAAKPLRVNVTPSEPEGLYLVAGRPVTVPPIHAFVSACPPVSSVIRLGIVRHYLAPGSCPDGAIPILKQIAAVPGDHVTTTRRGVLVNGHLLPNTAPVADDPHGRPLPHYPFGTYTVPPDRVWLLSTYSPRSFDSRYFGPVPVTAIRAIVHPWIVQ